MAGPFQGFATRMLGGSVLTEVLKHVPGPAREALTEVRDYVSAHGKLPKPELLRRTPLTEPSDAVNVMLGELGEGQHARMVNVWKGALRGGSLRACNVAVSEVHAGHVSGVNVLVGSVLGGVVERVNLVIGDVRGGELRSANIVLGDVHGGVVECYFLVGDVYGGRVDARHMLGTVHAGDARIHHWV